MTEGSEARSLLRWYRRGRRDLPWRRTGNPYAVWISEVMLQQTTVAAVTPRWRRFLARFPDVGALARAPLREVLGEWAGLGYYARARNLHRAAKTVAAAGAFPVTVEEWRALPGVGPYTAAALASIVSGVAAAAVDGNVSRVLSRLHALRLDPRSPRGRREVASRADALLARSSPGEFNQAVMELGATLCTPRAPRCPVCPLRASCRARSLGTPEAFPPSSRREAPRPVRLVAGVAFRRGRILLVRDEELVRGQLTVPLFRVPAGRRAEDVLQKEWKAVAGLPAGALEPLARLRHPVLDRRYDVHVFLVEESAPSRRRRPRSPSGLRLLFPGDLARHAHGGLLLKILGRLPGAAVPR